MLGLILSFGDTVSYDIVRQDVIVRVNTPYDLSVSALNPPADDGTLTLFEDNQMPSTELSSE
jgi:hypothetical protein